MSQEHPSFVTVYQPMAGWKAVYYSWSNDAFGSGHGGYEPEFTGLCGYATEEEAEHEARAIAEAHGVTFEPRTKAPQWFVVRGEGDELEYAAGLLSDARWTSDHTAARGYASESFASRIAARIGEGRAWSDGIPV